MIYDTLGTRVTIELVIVFSFLEKGIYCSYNLKGVRRLNTPIKFNYQGIPDHLLHHCVFNHVDEMT
ncbi:protein of unknown function [Shewanella benthica]|uniref:Uncharacterized protein n=1 Tax=Shewanella benthica TaxID=43661 RepID=A0A330M475_9GAMM|nr:protein of unknown function [Shewanella benthica]